MTQHPIGILGGMGPEATILLQRKLVEAMPVSDDRDHIPLLIDMNTQVPSRIAHLIDGAGEDPGPTLAAMARRLQDAGAVALAIPCNTAHHYAKAITDAVTVPLLNMVELAADHAVGTLGKGGCVGVLASPAVRRICLSKQPCTRTGCQPFGQRMTTRCWRRSARSRSTVKARRHAKRCEHPQGPWSRRGRTCSLSLALNSPSLPTASRMTPMQWIRSICWSARSSIFLRRAGIQGKGAFSVQRPGGASKRIRPVTNAAKAGARSDPNWPDWKRLKSSMLHTMHRHRSAPATPDPAPRRSTFRASVQIRCRSSIFA